MTSFSPWVFSFSLLLAALTAKAKGDSKTTEVELLNSKEEKVGTASLAESAKGVKIKIQVSHLPPGEHGIHFHEAGICTPPDFKSAGEHFNPAVKKHGMKNPEGPHAGDLPNLKVDRSGSAKTEFTTSRVTLKPGKNSLLKEGSTALVIHAKLDDQMSQPSGDSGDRIVCGVIK